MQQGVDVAGVGVQYAKGVRATAPSSCASWRFALRADRLGVCRMLLGHMHSRCSGLRCRRWTRSARM